nr:hypothetical protein [Tanacetum cinerariifolium]GEZ93996.1 hypothetical protein [Tanacetum cinerariifolium]
MESLNPQVVAAAKLPILNPIELDLWKMRIEKYFLMIDYSLWEVILNGDSPTPTRIVDGVVQVIAPTNTEQRLAKRNELKQIDADDLEKMDLKWQMTMLTMRARRFLQKTGKNLGANGTTAIGFNIFKVECYNCHRRGRFARKCKSPKDNMNKDTPRRTVLVEVSTSNALVSQCDAVGSYDWIFQADEEPTNYALMAYASSGSSSSLGYDNEVAPCLKACSKVYATLQTHYDKLTVDFRMSQFDVLSYKISLESVEARLVVYQKNKNVFEEDIKLLKLDVMLRDNALVERRKKFEKAKKEKDDLKLTLEKFQSSSKNLMLHSYESDDSVLKILVNDRYKTGEWYYAVPPPYIGTFMPPKPDLVFNDAPKASETVTNVVNVESNSNKPSTDMSMTLRPDAPIIEDWTFDSEDETELESVPKQKEPSFVPTSEHVKTPRESVKKVKHHKQAKNLSTDNQKSRGHKNSWNKKACFVCKSLNHLIKDCDYYEKQMVQKAMCNHTMRVNHHNSVRMTHPHSNRNVVPTAVLSRPRLVSLNVARPVLTAVPRTTVKSLRPVKHVINKAHLPIRRPINHIPGTKNSNFNKKFTTVKVNKVNVVQCTKGNAEKALTNWVWKPKCTILDHVFRLTSASMTLKKFDYTDALGRSKSVKL